MKALIGLVLALIGATAFAVSSIELWNNYFAQLSDRWLGVFVIGWILIVIGIILMEKD